MRHNDVIFLITKTVEYDDLGNQVTNLVERLVYANQMTVSMNEFYEAGNSGLKPEKQFQIYSFEYNGESELKHNDADYKIIRESSKGDKSILICERVVGL